MKAKLYIGIISALMLASIPLRGQYSESAYYVDGRTVVVSNYYDDNDYYYSSRLNRFHRSYTSFNYYSPVFTETYWYSYQPYSWGLSIYRGGLGFSKGYSFYYPLFYGYDYGYDYGWYDPFYSSSSYRGSDPFYISYWYTPVVINVNVRNKWSNHYYGLNRHSHRDYDLRWNNRYRPVHNTYNTYYYNNTRSARYPARSSNNEFQSRSQAPSPGSTRAADSRRETSSQVSRYPAGRNSDGRISNTETRRSSNVPAVRGQDAKTNNSNPDNRGVAAENTRRTGELRNNSGKTRDVIAPRSTTQARRETTVSRSVNKRGSDTESNSSGSARSSEKSRRK